MVCLHIKKDFIVGIRWCGQCEGVSTMAKCKGLGRNEDNTDILGISPWLSDYWNNESHWNWNFPRGLMLGEGKCWASGASHTGSSFSRVRLHTLVTACQNSLQGKTRQEWGAGLYLDHDFICAFFFNLFLFYIHGCSAWMHVCESHLLLVPMEVIRGLWIS